MSCAASNILQMGRVNVSHKIVVVQDEMPSNVYPWQHLAAATGATLSIVPRPKDHNWTKSIIQHIDEHVAVVALGCVHWCDGGFLRAF